MSLLGPWVCLYQGLERAYDESSLQLGHALLTAWHYLRGALGMDTNDEGWAKPITKEEYEELRGVTLRQDGRKPAFEEAVESIMRIAGVSDEELSQYYDKLREMAYATVDGVKTYPTGGKREGTYRYDLLPPRALRELAIHFGDGAAKYGDRNWEKGYPMSLLVQHLLGHVVKLMEGDRSERHDRAIAWNAMALLEFAERVKEGSLPAEIDDIGLTHGG